MTVHNDKRDETGRKAIAMVEGCCVWTEFKGQRVSGEIVYLVPRSINVEITRPYCGVIEGLSIPYFACWFPSVQYFQAAGRITPHGASTADRLLLELDRSCRCFDTNRNELACSYLRLAGAIAGSATGIEVSEFRERRASLRRLLKAREISSMEYQRALKVLKKSVRKPPMIEFEAATGLSQEIFKRHGLRIPVSTVQQLVTKFLI